MARLAGLVLALTLVVVVVVQVRPGAARQQPTFTSGVELVTFGVTAVDRRGQLVTTLSAEDFEVFEDGVRQQVRHFVRGQGDAAVPLHLGLLVDTSGSMERDLKLARSAAIKFLNTLPEAADMTLVDFDTEVRTARFGQRDFARLVERIRSRTPEGMTALYDALGVYLDAADDEDGRQVLVVYTDGGDTRSTLGYGDLLTLLKASRATVYAVGLLEHQGSAQAEQRMRLTQIAEQTGGLAFFPSKLEDLDASYAKVADDIHAQYQLGYLSTNTASDGTWRKVDIRARRKDVRLRTRKGYFAAYKD